MIVLNVGTFNHFPRRGCQGKQVLREEVPQESETSPCPLQKSSQHLRLPSLLTHLRALGSSRKAEGPRGKEGGNTLPSVLPALPRGPPGLTSCPLPYSTLGEAAAVHPGRPALLWDGVPLRSPDHQEHSRRFKQQSQTANWPKSGNWAASPERSSRQPEVTKQVRT